MEDNKNISVSANETEIQTQAPANVPYPATPQYNFYPPTRAKKPKKEVNFKKKDKVFMGLFTLSALLIVFFGLFGMSIGLTASIWILAGITFFYLKDNGNVSVLTISSFAGTFISSLSFTFYGANGNNAFLSGLMTLACYIVFAISFGNDTIFDDIGGVLKFLFISVISPFVNVTLPLKGMVSKDSEKRKNIIQILAAVLVAIPILCVIIPLLMNSDAAFDGLMSYVAETIGITILKLILTVIISVLLMSFIVTNRYDIYDEKSGYYGKSGKIFKQAFTVTLLSLISVVYLAYLFSQLAYFVNAFKGLLPDGFTFADYARRGFFETETVAFINTCLIALLMWLTKRKENNSLPGTVKALMTFISAFSVFFIATAIAKMVMYIKTYGLTELRLFTSVFMLATVAFIVSMLVKIYKVDANTVKYAIAFSLVIFSLLSAVGLERTVASYNVNAYTKGWHKEIDIDYLYYLGESSMPYLEKLANSNMDVSNEAIKNIEDYFYSEYNFENKNFVVENSVIKAHYHKDHRFNLDDYKISKMYENLKLKFDPKRDFNYTDRFWTRIDNEIVPEGYYDREGEGIGNSLSYTIFTYDNNSAIKKSIANNDELISNENNMAEVNKYLGIFNDLYGSAIVHFANANDYYYLVSNNESIKEYSENNFRLYYFDIENSMVFVFAYCE